MLRLSVPDRLRGPQPGLLGWGKTLTARFGRARRARLACRFPGLDLPWWPDRLDPGEQAAGAVRPGRGR